MHFSNIVLSTLALLSTAQIATAAPAPNTGQGGLQNNETISLLSDNPTDTTDLVNPTDTADTVDTAQCRKDFDPCIHWRDCSSEKCRRELVFFGKMRCLPQKNV